MAVIAAAAILPDLAGLSGCTAPPARSSPAASPRAALRRAGSPPAVAPPARAAAPRWVPAPGTSWQWQLSTPVDTSVDAAVYDIDGADNPATVVRALHARGRRVICYVNVGAAENFRSDFSLFPPSVLGRTDGWPGERWLDVRRIGVLGPIMARRFDMCRAKGFDAVEADLVDGYTETTGFPLTGADQIAYDRLIAALVHARGMSVGLKNDLGQIPALLPYFDFAVNEQCAQYHECRLLLPFVRAGKAVLHVEYALPPERFCAETKALRFSSLRKHRDLGAWRRAC